jgi:membrane-bound lytic murein transglycosylase F
MMIMPLKKNNIRKFLFLLLSVTALVSLSTCNNFSRKNPDSNADLSTIRSRGKLVAVTDYNSINYFIYRGEPMGFQYEMLQQYADYLGVKIELIVSKGLDDAFSDLEKGKADLIAINLTVTNERRKMVDFAIPHSRTRQVLVQRKPENWRKLNQESLEEQLLRNQNELASPGVVVYVQKGSSYARRMHNLADEIGDSIDIVEVPDDAEKLISLVAEGEIAYTVCDENVARVSKTYYPNLDIETPLSFTQNLAWAVRKTSPELLVSLNDWMQVYRRSSRYAILYNKYFESERTSYQLNSDYNASRTGLLSQYDELIRLNSKKIGWDWRLLASLIYQESRFDPKARSWAGAYGLMQLMPGTANRFGIDTLSSPADNIRAGAELLGILDNRFRNEVKDQGQREKFVLASYNVGLGHVLDARRLAEKSGLDPNVWDNSVDKFLKEKSDPKIYKDPVVEFGYCRGDLALNYVNDILVRYEHYKNIDGRR